MLAMKIVMMRILFLGGLVHTALCASRPHILVIMADDMGWNDVGWRDPDMRTPILDRLASEGVVLTNAYMQQVCTPSRAAFLSGKYPFRYGMQNSVLSATDNGSLPLYLRLLPERLKELGYATHMVGKWHLGYCKWQMTPTFRGFDSFYGMLNGVADYFTHIGHQNGYDLRLNDTVLWSEKGQYSTHLFTKRTQTLLDEHDQTRPLFIFLSYQAVHGPLQVPDHYITRFCSHVTNETRRIHCAMTAAMDEGIGNITATLQQKGYMDNLLIFFTSDNGGPVKLGSSNWPLRGSKITLWEGGTKAVSFLHSRTLLKGPYTYDGIIHAVDWYPTFLGVAGDSTPLSKIDGVNQWQSIVANQSSARTEFVYNVDDIKETAALRMGRYKLVYNNPGNPDGWYNPPVGTVEPPEPVRCGPRPEYMLFDLTTDPSERHDIKFDSTKQTILSTMIKKMKDYQAEMVPSEESPSLEASKPARWGGAWTPGWC